MAVGNPDRDYYFSCARKSNITVRKSEDCLYTSGLTCQTTIQFYSNRGEETAEQEIVRNGQDATMNLSVHEDSVIIDIPASNQQMTANWLE